MMPLKEEKKLNLVLNKETTEKKLNLKSEQGGHR